MTTGDLDWLIDEVGVDEEIALELLSAADWAEMQRLIDIYGYPKDNVRTPALKMRLSDTAFANDFRDAARGQGPLVETACERAISAAS